MIQYFINLLVYFFYLYVPVLGSNLQKSCFTFCSIFTKEEACHPLYPGPVPPLMQSITVFCTMCHSFCNVTMGEPRCSLGPDKGPRLSPLLLNVLLQLLFLPARQDVHLKNKIKMRYSRISSTLRKVSKYFSCPFADTNSWLSGWSADSEIPSSFND